MQIFYPPEAAGEADRTLSLVREHGRFDGEGWRVRKDGSRFWAHVIITPLWDDKGRMRGYVRVAQDITDRKRGEEELKRAKEEAERANIAKSKFLAAASPRSSPAGPGDGVLHLGSHVPDPEHRSPAAAPRSPGIPGRRQHPA